MVSFNGDSKQLEDLHEKLIESMLNSEDGTGYCRLKFYHSMNLQFGTMVIYLPTLIDVVSLSAPSTR